MIRFIDVYKEYDNGTKALKGINLRIDDGEFVFLVGPSGSGKSTFLRSLNLLEEPTGGSIIFNGVDITKKKIKNAEGKTVKAGKIPKTSGKYAAIGSAAAVLCVAAAAVAITVKRKRK